MKTLVKILAVLLILVVAIVLALPLWIGPVATTVVNAVGPKFLGTKVELGSFALNPYSGRFAIGGFKVWNPPQYSQEMAVTLGDLEVTFDSASLASEVIHIKAIRLNGLFASYLGTKNAGLTGEKNIDCIALNLIGPSYTNETEDVVKEASTEPGFLDTHKFIIDLVQIDDLNVQVGPITTPVPVPTISEIGVASGGVSWKCAWEEIWGKFLNAMGSTGTALGGLGKDGLKIGQEGLKIGQEGLGAAIDAVQNVDVSGAADAIKDSGEKLKSFGKDLKNLFK